MALLRIKWVFTPAGRPALTAIPSAATRSGSDLTSPMTRILAAAQLLLLLAPIRATTQAEATIRPDPSTTGRVPRDAASAGSDAHGVGWR
jgi:hypothetical protein